MCNVEKQIQIDVKKKKNLFKIKSEAIGRRHASNMLLSGMKKKTYLKNDFYFISSERIIPVILLKSQGNLRKIREIGL